MELQTSDSKKVLNVFDASKNKRSRKKRKEEGLDDSNSVATDESHSACLANMSSKTSLQDLPTGDKVKGRPDDDITAREKCSCSSIPRDRKRSPRRHKRHTREGLSLALKAGMASTPRSNSPSQAINDGEQHNQDQDSMIYAYLEEAIKRDKKHRHGRRHDDHKSTRDHDDSESREHRHKHRKRRDEVPSRDREKPHKEESPPPAMDQTALLETFAKLCAKMNEKSLHMCQNCPSPVRTQSHKSLQCEVASRHDYHSVDRHPERIPSHDHVREGRTPTCIRSQENCRQNFSRDKIDTHQDSYPCCYGKPSKYDNKLDYKESKYMTQIKYVKEPKYESKINLNSSRVVLNSRVHEDDRYHSYPPEPVATRTFIDHRDRRDRECRDYDRRHYDDDGRRYVEQKTSRSFDVHRERYDDERCRRTARSDAKDKRYDDKYYEKHAVEAPERHFPNKDRRSRRPSDRFDRISIASREDDRDRFSEKERDSGLSVADGDTSTLSGRTGRSNYLRTVKQEIAEQREAMDKMMKLWKELMRCFKGISHTQDKSVNENACESMRDSAAAQLRLWRECMRRYETVARDVGDTDARLMEEINKQRSEMSEMATMWQECLQRYRDMSNDFNTLKKQLTTPESPTRLPAAAPLICAEGEGTAHPPQYRMPPSYPQLPPNPGNYPTAGSTLRGRASVPPAWWWGDPPERHSPRRRSSRHSSPDSREGRDVERDTDRDRRHRHKDTRDERYKDKPHKPSGSRSEHRRRKR